MISHWKKTCDVPACIKNKNFRLLSLIFHGKLTKNLCFTVPGDPQDVKVTPLNSTTIKVEWKPPQMRDRNGIILGYHVHVQEIKEEVCCKSFLSVRFS